MNEDTLNSISSTHVDDFVQAKSIHERWTAARELMAAKELAKQVANPQFLSAYADLGQWARNQDALRRLLAVDLVIRIASFAKKLRPQAERMLRAALTHELPPLSLAAETKDLPPEAKPAEIRENVAMALEFAQGDWVEGYIIRSLAEEDRSQRCRIELAQQMAKVQPACDVWFESLIAQPAIGAFYASKGGEAAAAQLRDLCSALADIVSRHRNQISVSTRTGPLLGRFVATILPISSQSSLPPRLDSAAVDVARLLDELLLAHLSLISTPEAYAALEVLHRWWQPLPYPEDVKVALGPIQNKIAAAIVLLARTGSRSDALVGRLRQVAGDRAETDRQLRRIADEEPSLPIDIQDWLRGKRRTTASIGEQAQASLEAVASENFIEALAGIFLALELAWHEVSNQDRQQLTELQRAVQRVRVEATGRGLEVVGQVGDVVDYSASAHQTLDGTAPSNPRVRIVRPMVVRKLFGGGSLAVIRALVAEVR